MLADAIRLMLAVWLPAAAGFAQKTLSPLPGSEDCMGCHEDGPQKARREPGMPPPFGAAALRASPHAALECSACHAALAGKELPHPEKLAPVDCGACHAEEQEQYSKSLHGTAARRGNPLAPGCKTCHGTHNILRPADPRSRVSTMEIPKLCGGCHREGSPVQRARNAVEEDVLGHYKDSIHGEGLFSRGLTVTAVCTSCHTAHLVLPAADPRSSIAKANVSKTCTRCHAMIETVHRKVIRGELWEKQPHMIPVCVDCHAPHTVRKVFYTQGMADRDCLRCHGSPEIRSAGGRSLFVNHDQLLRSRHSRVACVQCHTGGSPAEIRPCRTMAAKVDCSICHAEIVNTYRASTHGQLLAKESPDAPSCRDCHGAHGIQGKNDSASPTFSRNVPALCAKCHRAGKAAARRYNGKDVNPVEHYAESIHGKGLIDSGLTVTANCADCHTAHGELPAKDPRSSVNRNNVAKTCAQCHRGIYELFSASVHSPAVTKSGKPLPVCSDCHSAHSIQRTDLANFRLHIMDQCGRCHEEITRSYFDTFHGKVAKLGYLKAAKCYDCHGAHDILPVNDIRSRLSRNNIVKTCGKCHTGSHRQFAGYLTHATHHDPVKYPFLFYTFWGMTCLLVGTLVVSCTHTAMWLPRSLKYRKELQAADGGGLEHVYIRRFDRFTRNLHLMVISSFLGLAVTGMTLKFSYAAWAKVLARALGGFEATGLIHRACALLTFTYFGLHLWDLVRRRRRSGKSWRAFITDPEGLLLNRRDWHEFVGSIKWFLGLGPRPKYGRWTYWEKFDYFAVFWGVAVIGSTGLLLWFPVLFTSVLPGWIVNVATTIHSDEALLAVSFIVLIHFFNTHFRPEKFPMDTVIFTGGTPLEEFKRDRPREYNDLARSGKLEEHIMPPPLPIAVKFWRRLGFTALAVGLGLVALIVYAMVFAYR